MSSAQGNGPAQGDDTHGFLAELARAVKARVEELRTLPALGPDPAFLDKSKVVHEWPDVSAYVIEELR